jgi:hypothetical protein
MAALAENLPVSAEMPRLGGPLPPEICGVADLTDFAFQGRGADEVMARLDAFHDARGAAEDAPARMLDTAIACQLAFRRALGLELMEACLARQQLFRVAAPSMCAKPLRVLALMAPGALMVNTPIDFLTASLDVRLDLLYLLPGQPLPDAIPDHDVAFFCAGEADAAMQARLEALFAAWPRPVLNDPRFLPALGREVLAAALAGIPGICSPHAVAVDRAALDAHIAHGRPIPGFAAAGLPYPYLIRPRDSHAGHGLARVRDDGELAEYLRFSFEKAYFVTAFEDYAGPDGLYRKCRVAFIDGRPFLCHMAVSEAWMVHYLNAGMTESAAKRQEEAEAMATFDAGFAARHAAAFARLHEVLGFDYYQIDCAETRDGRLLVFEADCAAIVHLMDPAEMFPYKQPAMRRVFAAFGAMLRARAKPSAG